MTAYTGNEKYEVVRMAMRATLVTRHGGLVVHPAAEHRYEDDEVWGVSAECGLSLGRFGSRGAAEMYAGLIAKILDWKSCPSSVEDAAAWASRVTDEQRIRIADALRDARASTARPLPWELE